MEDDIGTITEALALQIQKIFGPLLPTADINKDILFAPEDIALRQRGEATSGRNRPQQQERQDYSLEFASFWLEDAKFSWERNRTPMARTGLNIGQSGANGSQRYIKAVPIDLEFSLTFWTLKRKVANNFIKQFCFMQMNQAKLDILWEGNIPITYQFFIMPNIPRSDTVSKMYVQGKYWKPKVYLTIEAWVFENIPIRTVQKIVLDVWTDNGSQALGTQSTETHVVHEVIQ